MGLLIIDLSPMEGQIICPPGSGLHLAEAWAVSAGNPSQTAGLVLGDPIPGEFTRPTDVPAKLHRSPADSLRGILAKEAYG